METTFASATGSLGFDNSGAATIEKLNYYETSTFFLFYQVAAFGIFELQVG